MFTQKIKKPLMFFAAILAVGGFFSVSAMADDVQDAINAAGFGGSQPNADVARVQDPNAKPAGNASAPASSGGSSYADYTLGVDYKLHTYMNTPNLKVQFQSYGEESPLPKPDSATEPYDYGKYFQRQSGQTVIGLPPAASDGRITSPCDTWWTKDGQMTKDHPMYNDPLYRYSGDQWGDCLGPHCVDRSGFRAPVGSWVHFTEIGTTRADQYHNLIGFNDTLIQLSQRFGGQAYELTGDQR